MSSIELPRAAGRIRGRRRLRRPVAAVALVITAAVVGSAAAVAVPVSASAVRDPVIVVAGTFSPAAANAPLAARLRADGYHVDVFVLPTLGTQDIRASARALAAFVERVRATTGAARVDLVGHSQGGLVARSYVKDAGGAGRVDSLVTLGAPHRGASIANLLAFLGLGDCLGVVACRQMRIGSTFLADLNAGDVTIGAVRYTTFRTAQDELVRPVRNATLPDGATNVLVQAQCPLRVVGHVGLILDGTVYSGVRQALEGRTAIHLACWAP